MGCFLTCFGGAKESSRRRRRRRSPIIDKVNENYKPLLQNKVLPRLSSCEEKECREKTEVVKKKVTFDLNVKAYDNVLVEEFLDEDEEEKAETQPNEPSFPENHRYGNCGDNYDDDGGDEEEDYYEDCDFSDDDDGEFLDEGNEESYDSFFSLPIEENKRGFREVNSPNTTACAEIEEKPAVAPKGNARDRSQYVHSVLNPVENLSQWREVKARPAAPSKGLNDENSNLGQENVAPPLVLGKPELSVGSKTSKQECSVDASLSNWLATSENSSVEGPQLSCFSPPSNSTMSREERPILGALTVDDIKRSTSQNSTPRKSPSRSPDETPIIGTVGSYWHCKSGCKDEGKLNTTTKYREDQRVNWDSTPFEVRLERAMKSGIA